MSNDEQDLTTTDEQQEEPQTEAPKGRSKRNRASSKAEPSGGKSSGGEAPSAPKKTPEGRRTTRDGKPVRKTASGFTVVG